MIKRYYIEETDGKETKRTLTTFNELDDMRNYSDIEIQEMLYEVSAELISKGRKWDMLVKEINARYEEGETDIDAQLEFEASQNIKIAKEYL
nr:MAG TPA: hypothetical protein [Caudoviricetes sp.]